MNIIFMGTPQFAVPALERLIESRHRVSLVVTQPDKKSGRGLKVTEPPVKETALRHGLPVAQPEKVRGGEFLELLRAHEPDLIVVVAYGRILPPAVLCLPRHGCVNIHASLLPCYRGAAPINWAIINGERQTGVSIMQMDEGMDTGGVIAREEIDILEDDDAVSVGNMLSVLGASKLMEVLDTLEKDGAVNAEPQDNTQATYAPILKKEDGRIDWNQRTDQILCRVRGANPWPGAFTTLKGEPFKIRSVEPIWGPDQDRIDTPAALPPGAIATITKGKGFTIRTGDGFLVVTSAQPAGKTTLSVDELVNGRYIAPGLVLGE